jgi:hypothetical protein
MSRPVVLKLAAIGLALINGILLGYQEAARAADWGLAMLISAVPLLFILFPNLLAGMARWGLMASLASDFSHGIPPAAMVFLGWVLLGITTLILLLRMGAFQG